MKTSVHSKCSSEELKMLGDFWTLNIIQALSDGEKRFSELERTLPKVNPTTLTNRLKELEANKIVRRQTETVDRLSVVYMLTEKGLGILPVLKQIKIFADKYLT